MAGSVANDRITATGQWRIGGGAIAGDWKRAQVAAAAPSASNAPKGVASYNGTYTGRLCTQFLNKEPGCWTVVLVVRDGVVEGNYVNNPTKKTAQASGTVVANGAFELKLASWTSKGDPNEAVLVGSVANDRITASGRWRTGGAIEGSWKRAPL